MRKLAIAVSLFCATTALSAQTLVPSQFATAHTVFFASGGAPGSGGHEKQIAEIVYTTFYKALSAVGRYQLVENPSSADLAMNISAQSRISDVTNGSSTDSAYLRLEIYDVKTHMLIWTINEDVQGAFREKTFQRNVDTAVTALIDDLNTLANGNLPGDTSPAQSQPAKSQSTKTRLSSEGK